MSVKYGDYVGILGGLMVSQLDYETLTEEFES